MTYDFDRIIDRKNTNSAKWDAVEQRHQGKDIIPMWVADMDFRTAPPIIEALKKQADHGIYGYMLRPQSYLDAVVSWVKRRHDWEIDSKWLTYSPGVVTALDLCVLTFTRPGDKVIVQPPVYYPFYRAIENNGRKIESNPLTFENDRHTMDFADLEKCAGPRTRLMIISNPHNPIGRVWTAEELTQLGNFCVKNNIILVSDEVHSDLIFNGYKHVPTASLSEEISRQTITCLAPSKTFNLAGLKTSVLIIPDQDIRKRYAITLQNLSLGMDNSFGLVALEAAYNHGEAWLEALLEYLEANMDFTIDFFRNRVPRIKARKSEGTYLLWLDCRDLGLSNEELDSLMLEKAGVWLDDGPMFGQGGEGFQRINIACPRAILEKALIRIESAVNKL